MSSDKRKRAIRARMVETGERYNVARRAIERSSNDTGSAFASSVVDLVARAHDAMHEADTEAEIVEAIADVVASDADEGWALLVDYLEQIGNMPEDARRLAAEYFEEWGVETPMAVERFLLRQDYGFGLDPERDGID